jgi:hypothetical protein
MIELTDLAPVAVRDRVRGTLTGWLAPAVVGSPEQDVFAILDLATVESDLLCHLDDARPTGDLLSRLGPARHPDGVRSVHPLRPDRLGLVLRLQHVGWYHDLQLAFDTPVSHPDQLPAQIEALLTRARAAA